MHSDSAALVACRPAGAVAIWGSAITMLYNCTQLQVRPMSDMIPHNAMIVVADGVGARFFRTAGHKGRLDLMARGDLKPQHLLDDGPSGHRPKESSHQETVEATFVKQLANELYRLAHAREFTALVIIADPRTLGTLRPLLHQEVQERVIREVAKSLTNASDGP
jgi:protein required for attachment to host cells